MSRARRTRAARRLRLPPQLAVVGAALALLALVGCGQTGPLTLPGAAGQDQSESPGAAGRNADRVQADDEDGEENGR